MQAYYEMEIDIPNNRQLHIQLPEFIPSGKVKVAIIYELPNQPPLKIQAESAKQLANLGGCEPELNYIPRR